MGRKDNIDEPLVASLASGASWVEAAKAAGCHKATVHRRLSDPDFVAKLEAAKTELQRRALDGLAAKTIDATRVLHEVATDVDAPSSARVSAARAIWDLTLRGREQADLQVRLEEIEDQLAAASPRHARLRSVAGREI